MHKTGNYSTHRVQSKSQNTTSQFSRNDYNKFRVKSLKAQKLHTKALHYGTNTETSHTNRYKFRV